MVDVTQKQFFRKLTKLPFVEAIWLYGSRARGDHRDRSDIDLAILCPNANDRDWRRVMDIVGEADTLLKIDCVRFDELSISSPLYAQILADRVTLFSIR
jgi:predicted nucleotidyltransferase